MNNIIYVIYVNTGYVGFCLDAIRLLANINTKRYSHVTVRGPYDVSMDNDEIKELNSHIGPESISIDGFGNFFKSDQNTVFFTCSGKGLKQVWDKKGYEYYPHITIYDGDNTEFAKTLYDTIKDSKFHIKCGKDELEEITIGNGTNGFLIDNIELDKVPSGLSLPSEFPKGVSRLTEEQKLSSIKHICQYLSKNPLE